MSSSGVSYPNGRFRGGGDFCLGSDTIVGGGARPLRVDKVPYFPDPKVKGLLVKAFAAMAKKDPDLLQQPPDVIEQRLMETAYGTDERGLMDLWDREDFWDTAYAAHNLVMSLTGGLPNPDPGDRAIYVSTGDRKTSGGTKLLAAVLVGAVLAAATGLYLYGRHLYGQYLKDPSNPQPGDTNPLIPPPNDTPEIKSIKVAKVPEAGRVNVEAEIKDLDGLKEVLIELNGTNSSMSKSSVNLSAPTVYYSNISMGDREAVIPFKIYAIDSRNNSAIESGMINWNKSDSMITSAYLNGKNATIARLVTEYIPGMMNYPLSFLPTVDAIYYVCYKNPEHYNQLMKKGEDYLWRNGIAPAVNYVIKLENEGKIDVLDKVLSTNSTLDNLLKQKVIFPIELCWSNMTSGQRDAGWWKMLDVLEYNTNPSPALNNTSPQEYMGTLIRNFYEEKGGAYGMAVDIYAISVPYFSWPNCHDKYKDMISELRSSNQDLPLFIKGIPIYMYAEGKQTPLNCEQGTPYYSVLVGREFGVPVVVQRANYPETTNGPKEFWHEEPAVWLGSGKFFCFWSDIPTFLSDYPEDAKPVFIRFWNFNNKEYLVSR
ncbi:MAG: hypothetical protein QXX77_02945 [Candidatus Methanosuratincola sp.]